MPRKKNASSKGSLPTATRRSTRQAASQVRQEDSVPEVFQDMLIEAFHNNPQDFAPSPRPVKRRKVNNDDEDLDVVQEKTVRTPSPPPPVSDPESPLSVAPPERVPQTAFNNDFSDEDESDVSFEDVDIPRDRTPVSEDETERPKPKSLQLDLSGPSKPVQSKQALRAKVKPLTKAERIHRLNVHKWHLLCLLLHVQTVNHWCDDQTIQKTLKPLIQRKISNQLHLPETKTQAERKFAFDNAISEICLIWKAKFRITAQGMRKAHWRDQLDMEAELENAPDPVDLEDFQSAAKSCQGTRDLGAQLFCALLRSLAVDTRIVCSLQVLPFARTTNTTTPQKPPPAYITAGAQDFGRVTPSRPKKKKIVDSPFPIWWVEVFSPAITDWVPLDPIVRNTINKPRTGFEPAASDPLNNMSYVIAFEEDGTAKDITRRYTSYYNAKTRRTRVEITKGGLDWFNSVMQHFAKPTRDRDDRDDIEDAALNRRVNQEGMPKNVQDLKDHPVYVLERHLRNNEVIEPKRECGKFSVGSGKNGRLESVYRREDVHSCRSSEGWYRRGRDIRPGEQPLKRAVPRKKRATSLRLEDDDGEEEDDSVPMYAEFQTDLYVPPPVLNGQVPRNGYGNLDVYVSTMIPAGGVHIRHTLARQAAKALKIDAAEAVTGFVFKGRQGTAVIDGVVVDAQNTAAMLTTITALEDQLDDETKAQRTAILSSLWKKMHAVLRVRQRIQDEYGERAGVDMDATNDDEDDDPSYDDADGGGFMPDVHDEPTKESRAEEAENLKLLRERAPVVLPSLVVKQRPVVVRSPHKLPNTEITLVRNDTEDLFGDNEIEAGGFLPENQEDGSDNGGGFMVEDGPPDQHVHRLIAASTHEGEGSFLPEQDDQSGGFVLDNDNEGGFLPESDTAGGFLPEDDGDMAGGFVPELETVSNIPERSEQMDPRVESSTRQIPIHESSANNQPVNNLADQTTIHNPNPMPHSTQETVSTTTSRRSKRKQKEKQSVPALENDGSLSDNSLPSHDPEEDDLEMQWVEDAFED